MKLSILLLIVFFAQKSMAGSGPLSVCFESENNRCYSLSKENQSITVSVLGKVVQTKKIKETKGKELRKEFESVLKIPPERNIAKILECNTPVKIVNGAKSRQVCFFKLSNKFQGKISDWVQLVSAAIE